MIHGIIHNKRFKLYTKSGKIRNPYLSEDEIRYIKACVKDILQYCEKDKRLSTEEFIAKNLPDYGIKVISHSYYNKKDSFFRDFLSGAGLPPAWFSKYLPLICR